MSFNEIRGNEPLKSAVKNIILQRVRKENQSAFFLGKIIEMSFGKMLRTSFASKILGGKTENSPGGVEYVCASVELIHTASLFHDDVIDGAALRRGMPALWKTFTPNSAILTGDVLLCEALQILLDSQAANFVRPFSEKVREVCITEAQQELVLRGKKCDLETSLRIARGKTGPLFALVGLACGGTDRALSSALEEAGYRVGTAYQLLDDLIDESGDEKRAGKTLGTDRLRSKFTLAHRGGRSKAAIMDTIKDLFDSSLLLLHAWPAPQAGVREFIREFVYPVAGPVAKDTLPPSSLISEYQSAAGGL
jgi:geranylgeranyl pyrophosphate synthase